MGEEEVIEGPRGARASEFEETLSLANNIFRLPDGSPRELDRSHSLLWRPENHRNLRILLVDGEVVSHVGISEREYVAFGNRVRVGFIGGVCTRPDQRNKGYASACLQDAIGCLTRRGATLMPVSGRRSLYFRHDCACAGTRYGATVARGQLCSKAPGELNVYTYSDDMFEDLLRIYQQEPMRYLRPREIFARTLSRGQTEVVCANGRPVAFVKYGVKEREGDKMARISELVGSREAICDALILWAERDDWDTISIGPLNAFHDAIRHALWRVGVKVRRNESPSTTVRVINFPGLMESMEDYFRERLGSDWDRLVYYQHQGSFIFGFRSERFELKDRTQLALFMLGAASPEDDIEPPPGPLGNLLRAVFPIPYVFPGSDGI